MQLKHDLVYDVLASLSFQCNHTLAGLVGSLEPVLGRMGEQAHLGCISVSSAYVRAEYLVFIPKCEKDRHEAECREPP